MSREDRKRAQPTDKNLSAFQTLIAPIQEAYPHVRFSYHAHVEADGLRICHARVFLTPYPSGFVAGRIRFQNQEVGHIPFSDLGLGVLEFVEQVLEGIEFASSDRRFRFPPSDNPEGVIQFRNHHSIGVSSSRFSLLTLTGSRFKQPRFSVELDWLLKGNNPPYDSLPELLSEFGLGGYDGDEAILQVSIPHLLEVDLKSPVEGQRAQPGLVLPIGVAKEHAGLGTIVYRRGHEPQRRAFSAAELTWSSQERPGGGTAQVGRCELVIPEGATVKCFATYAGEVHHEGWIGEPGLFPNWLRTMYECGDSDCEILRDFLFEEKKPRKEPADDFEAGVAGLFWMLGFGVLQLRSSRQQKNPDLLISTPGGRVALVECTTEVLDKEDKLSKLLARSEKVRTQLSKSGSEHVEIIPIIVTALPSAAVALDIEKAIRFGILVFTKESLESAFARSTAPQDPDALFQGQVNELRTMRANLTRDPNAH